MFGAGFDPSDFGFRNITKVRSEPLLFRLTLVAPSEASTFALSRGELMIKLILVSLFISSLSFAQMTNQEKVVRAAYAKLSYAIEQRGVTQLAMEAIGAAHKAPPAPYGFSVRLDNFTMGNAKDILDRRVIDLISPATNRVLDIQLGRHSYIAGGKESQWFEPTAKWGAASPANQDADRLTIRDFLQLQWQGAQAASTWQTYASYSVTVSYQGETAGPYQALFLFGRDSRGEEVVEPEDGTINAVALAAAMHEHIFADAFVTTELRNIPVVANWVNEREQADCSEDLDRCCELSSLRCGPRRSLVEKERYSCTRRAK